MLAGLAKTYIILSVVKFSLYVCRIVHQYVVRTSTHYRFDAVFWSELFVILLVGPVSWRPHGLSPFYLSVAI